MDEERWDVIPGAESREVFGGRLRRAVERIVAAHPGGRVVVFSHGAAIGELLAQATRSAPFAFVGPDNASISRIVVSPGRWIVRGYNDTAHLVGLTAMARIVIVHGAFNELWGPNELKARWLPAVRDGLWHHGVDVEADDVGVCFYGDLFRHHPGSDEDRQLEQSRAGVADMLSEMGADAIAALGQAAGEATFDRTVDMATVMLTEPDLRDRLRERIETEVRRHRGAGGALVGHRPLLRRAVSTTTAAPTPSSRSARRWPCRWSSTASSRRPSTAGGSARLGPTLGERAPRGQGVRPVARRQVGPGSRRSSSTTGTGPTPPSLPELLADRLPPSPRHWLASFAPRDRARRARPLRLGVRARSSAVRTRGLRVPCGPGPCGRTRWSRQRPARPKRSRPAAVSTRPRVRPAFPPR